jgi:hypothetical protein
MAKSSGLRAYQRLDGTVVRVRLDRKATLISGQQKISVEHVHVHAGGQGGTRLPTSTRYTHARRRVLVS